MNVPVVAVWQSKTPTFVLVDTKQLKILAQLVEHFFHAVLQRLAMGFNAPSKHFIDGLRCRIHVSYQVSFKQ
jgi:hypothetical protein